MYENWTDLAQKVMQLATQEAQRFHHEYIGTEHILLGLLKQRSGVAVNVLMNLDIDARKVRREVEKIVQAGPDTVTTGKLPQTPRAKKVIEYSIEEARSLNHNYIGTEHLLLGLLREQEGLAAQILLNLGLKLEAVRAEILSVLGLGLPACATGHASKPAASGMRPTPVLSCFGCDLTALARHGKLDPILGRKEERDQLLHILLRRHRPHALLLGPRGVGKTALVHGLAQSIVQGDVPDAFQGRRLVALNLARLAVRQPNRPRSRKQLPGGTSKDQRRPVPDSLLAVALGEAAQANVLVFLDDLHLFVDELGKLVGLLKSGPEQRDGPACIAAATLEAYRRDLAGNAFLVSVFQPVPVTPLPMPEVLAILQARRPHLEAFHQVQLAPETLDAALELVARHLPSGCLPGKAIDVLDQACARVRAAQPPQPPEIAALAAHIEAIQREKEQAIATHSFERAAQLRLDGDRLTRQHQALLEEWRQRSEPRTRVDAAVVAAVVEEMRRVDEAVRGVEALPRRLEG
jgi:ATP-dependent Clp protease ATP-binding subunit ClpC